MDKNWEEQYEDTAKRLELLGDSSAAEDIRTLVSALTDCISERDSKEKKNPRWAPRFLTPKDALDSDLPDKVEFTKEYFPLGVGPGSFDPKLMYAHALTMRASSVGGILPYETKSWVILWLLDHVDWEHLNV